MSPASSSSGARIVEKGAVLAELDDREAKATLEQAKANLAWAKAEVARYAELRQKQVVAKAEDQRKGIDLDLAQASLTLAEKALRGLHDPRALRRPRDGKEDLRGSVRQARPAGRGAREGRAAPRRAFHPRVRGRRGQGRARSSGSRSRRFPDRPFEGRIAYVGPSLRSEARTLVVEALVPNPGRLLKPGLFVTADIELPTTVPTLLAPRSAVVTEAGVSRAFVLGPDRVSERLVSLGEPRGDLVEVRSGLSAGERVVVCPDRRLTDGLAVAR